MSKKIPIPRARGSAVQVGKSWTWELEITIGNSEPIGMSPKEDAPKFLSKEAAIAAMQEVAQGALKVIADKMGHTGPLAFMDLKNNEIIPPPDKEPA